MTSPEPKTSLPSSETETQPSADQASPVSVRAENAELMAVPGETRSAPPPAEPPAPEVQSAQPEARRGVNWLAWLLALALLVCVLFYVQQVQQTQRLEGEVTALSAELAEANAKVQAHERQMGLIRDHVGDIVVRMAALQALVGGSVEAPAAIESPEPLTLPIDPDRTAPEPAAPPLSEEEASELGLPPIDRSSSDLRAEFEGIATF